jgi:hypothetical protein
MYDEEFDWENPNYANQHPAHLINASLDGPFQADLVSWVEDYWLEIAQLAWNGYSEGYRGCVIAASITGSPILASPASSATGMSGIPPGWRRGFPQTCTKTRVWNTKLRITTRRRNS